MTAFTGLGLFFWAMNYFKYYFTKKDNSHFHIISLDLYNKFMDEKKENVETKREKNKNKINYFIFRFVLMDASALFSIF